MNLVHQRGDHADANRNKFRPVALPPKNLGNARDSHGCGCDPTKRRVVSPKATIPARACASARRSICEDEMKTRKKSPCRHCSPAALQRSAGPPPIQRIRLLIDAACAARAGSAQMT